MGNKQIKKTIMDAKMNSKKPNSLDVEIEKEFRRNPKRKSINL